LNASALIDPIDRRQASWIQQLNAINRPGTESKKKSQRVTDLQAHFDEVDTDCDG
jgi:hypothetical protein